MRALMVEELTTRSCGVTSKHSMRREKTTVMSLSESMVMSKVLLAL